MPCGECVLGGPGVGWESVLFLVPLHTVDATLVRGISSTPPGKTYFLLVNDGCWSPERRDRRAESKERGLLAQHDGLKLAWNQWKIELLAQNLKIYTDSVLRVCSASSKSVLTGCSAPKSILTGWSTPKSILTGCSAHYLGWMGGSGHWLVRF